MLIFFQSDGSKSYLNMSQSLRMLTES